MTRSRPPPRGQARTSRTNSRRFSRGASGQRRVTTRRYFGRAGATRLGSTTAAVLYRISVPQLLQRPPEGAEHLLIQGPVPRQRMDVGVLRADIHVRRAVNGCRDDVEDYSHYVLRRERDTSGRWKPSAPGPCYVDEHGVVKWCLLLPHCRHSRERGLMRPSHAVSLDLSRINPS